MQFRYLAFGATDRACLPATFVNFMKLSAAGESERPDF